jgi:heme A synthase
MFARLVVHAAVYFAGVFWMLTRARGYKGLEVVVYSVVFGFAAVIAWFVVALTVRRQVTDPGWRFTLHVVGMVALFAPLAVIALSVVGDPNPWRYWRDIIPFAVTVATGAIVDGGLGYWLDRRQPQG